MPNKFKEFLKPLHEVLDRVKNCSGPMAKDYLMMHAKIYLADGNTNNAAYCILEALGIQIAKNYNLSLDRKEANLDQICERLQTAARNHKPRTTKPTCKKDKFFINELLRQTRTLPKEWTVLQVSKQYHDINFTLSAQEILMVDSGFWVTLIRYPRWELNNYQPIILEIPATNERSALYETSFNLIKDFKNILSFNRENDTKEARIVYWKKVEAYNKEVEVCLKEQIKSVASWNFLLLGEYDPNDKLSKQHEAKIFETVSEFCKKEKVNSEQEVLLSLVARSIHLLEIKDVLEFCTYFEKDLTKLNKMMKMLLTIHLKHPVESEPDYRLPCLLILDEHLDFLFWEMQFPQQPITRLTSFNILMSLYKKYERSIKAGYLEVDVSSGFAIVNPENNLPLMESRVTELLDHCLPHWEKMVQKKPTSDELLKNLKDHSVFMYFGHGSGLQYLNGNAITFASTNCVTFLFGCGSVQLNLTGGWHQMLGSHIYYHIAQCPAVFGYLISVTDYPTDCMASIIIERWLNVKNKWKNAEKLNWKTKESYLKLLEEKTSRESNLLKILNEIRMDNNKLIPPMQKMAMCLRGLPVKAK